MRSQDEFLRITKMAKKKSARVFGDAKMANFKGNSSERSDARMTDCGSSRVYLKLKVQR